MASAEILLESGVPCAKAGDGLLGLGMWFQGGVDPLTYRSCMILESNPVTE